MVLGEVFIADKYFWIPSTEAAEPFAPASLGTLLQKIAGMIWKPDNTMQK